MGRKMFYDLFPFMETSFLRRAHNSQWIFQDGVNKFDRLEGILPEAADWHAKVNLYKVHIND